MIELRWAVPPETTTARPVLQWRQRYTHGPANALGRAWSWTEWEPVPTVVVEPPVPQPTKE